MSLSYPEIFSVIFSSFSDLQLRVREPMGVASNSGASSVVIFLLFCFSFFKLFCCFMDWFSAHAKSADERSAGLCESQRVMHACVRMNSWTRAAAAAKWKLHESFFVEFLKHTLRASFQHVTYIHFIIRDSGCVRLASNNRSPHRVKSLRQHNVLAVVYFLLRLDAVIIYINVTQCTCMWDSLMGKFTKLWIVSFCSTIENDMK